MAEGDRQWAEKLQRCDARTRQYDCNGGLETSRSIRSDSVVEVAVHDGAGAESPHLRSHPSGKKPVFPDLFDHNPLVILFRLPLVFLMKILAIGEA